MKRVILASNDLKTEIMWNELGPIKKNISSFIKSELNDDVEVYRHNYASSLDYQVSHIESPEYCEILENGVIRILNQLGFSEKAIRRWHSNTHRSNDCECYFEIEYVTKNAYLKQFDPSREIANQLIQEVLTKLGVRGEIVSGTSKWLKIYFSILINRSEDVDEILRKDIHSILNNYQAYVLDVYDDEYGVLVKINKG